MGITAHASRGPHRQRVYMRPLRRAASVKYRDGRPSLSDAQVLIATSMPPPDLAVKIERLRHFGRLIRRGPIFVWAALDEDKRWLDSTLSSMTSGG